MYLTHMIPRSYKPYTDLIKYLFYDTGSNAETINQSLFTSLYAFINLFYAVLP